MSPILHANELEAELTAAREEVEIYKRDNKQLRKDVIRIGSTLKDFKEHRDRLAEALRIMANGTSCRECGGEDQALLAREALQSLNQNDQGEAQPPETKL